MRTYIALVNWTQKGIQEVGESPSRVQKAKAAIAAAGGEMKAFYLTLGRYDMIAVFEAPDDAAYAKVLHCHDDVVRQIQGRCADRDAPCLSGRRGLFS